MHGIIRHLRGHLLLFEPTSRPSLDASAGNRILLLAAGLEVFRVAAIRWLHPLLPLWLLLPLLLGIALVSVRSIGKVRLSRIGLRRWSEWTLTEKSYFLQVVIAAAALLLFVIFRSAGRPGFGSSLLAGFIPYLFYGFYQELVYRGMVQLDLVRRWGVAAGIVVANLLYTFGPLHWNYYSSRASLAVPMLAAIFLVGLFFGILYRRSGNLWIVAIFHAIGNAFMVWRFGAAG